MSSMCSRFEHGGLGWSTGWWSGEEINGGGKWEVNIREWAKLSEDSHSGYAALLSGPGGQSGDMSMGGLWSLSRLCHLP